MQKQFTFFSSALAIACAVLSLTGCRKDLMEPNPVDSVGPVGGGNTVTLDLPVSETDGFVNVTTKSVISENSSSSSYEEGLQKLEALEGKYSDVTVFQFDSGNKLVATYYQIFPEGNGGGIYVKSISGIKDEEYTFWAVANAGDLSGFVSTGDDVSKMADLVLEMPSVETNLVQYWEKGFPKVAKTELTTIDSSNPKFKLKFDRLVARVLFSLTTNLKYGSFEVTSLAVRQCNSKVYPFGTSKAVNVEDVMTGEMTSQIDLEALNSNDGSMYAYFYVPENMQGVPASLEGNTNPKNKNAETIGEPLASLSTYLELTGVYTEGSGQLQTENHYRAYLGQNATNNLDVQRNTSTRFALSLKDDSSVLKGDWSADRNYDPSMDQRELAITPNPIQVSNEVGGVFTVYSKGVRYNKYCKYSLSQNLVDAGVVIDGYVLRQTKELDADVEGTLTATSWDGVKTATADVKALKYAPAVIITPTPSASSSSVETMQMRMTVPVQTKMLFPKVTLSDGTQATITALESPTTAALEEGNTSYSKPIVKGKGSLSNNFYYQIEVTAGKEGKATIHNTCKLTVTYTDTKWSAEDDEPTPVLKKMNITGVNDIDLTVEEDRTITFSNAKQSLYSGETGTAQVVTNFDGSLTFSSSAGSEGFVIRKNGLEDSVVSDIAFKAGVPQTIEYQYNGSDDKTVDLEAEFEYEYGEDCYGYLYGYQTLNYIYPEPMSISMIDNVYYDNMYNGSNYALQIDNPSNFEFYLKGCTFVMAKVPDSNMASDRILTEKNYVAGIEDPSRRYGEYYTLPDERVIGTNATAVNTFHVNYHPSSNDPQEVWTDYDFFDNNSWLYLEPYHSYYMSDNALENAMDRYYAVKVANTTPLLYNTSRIISYTIIDIEFYNSFIESNHKNYIILKSDLSYTSERADWFYNGYSPQGDSGWNGYDEIGSEGSTSDVGLNYQGMFLIEDIPATASEDLKKTLYTISENIIPLRLPFSTSSYSFTNKNKMTGIPMIVSIDKDENNNPLLVLKRTNIPGVTSLEAYIEISGMGGCDTSPNGTKRDPVYNRFQWTFTKKVDLLKDDVSGIIMEAFNEKVHSQMFLDCYGWYATSANTYYRPACVWSYPINIAIRPVVGGDCYVELEGIYTHTSYIHDYDGLEHPLDIRVFSDRSSGSGQKRRFFYYR